MGGEVESLVPRSLHGWRGKGDLSQTCNFCLGKGHWKNECPVLKAKNKVPKNSRRPKPVALAAPAHQVVRDEVIAAVRLYTNTKPVAAAFSDLSPGQPEIQPQPFLSSEVWDPGYAPYIRGGHVSLSGSDRKVLAKILRNTGALESYVTESALPFSCPRNGSHLGEQSGRRQSMACSKFLHH